MKAPIDHARDYVAAGLSVVPIASDGTKRPPVSWKRYQEHAPSSLELTTLFSSPDRGVAIIHGAVSGGTEVIDLDDGDLLGPFVEALDHAAPGLYKRLCVIQTPRPGYHVVYRSETVEGNQKLAMRPPNTEEVAEAQAENRRAGPVTLIETRGEGGYTLAPGTPGACHPTGRKYVHFEGPPLTELVTITPEERAALFMAARSLDRLPPEEPSIPQRPNVRTHDGESPGDAYAKATSWEVILEPHGWVRVDRGGDKAFWRRPGKSDGWSATTGAMSEAGNELLCVFSTNAYPFEGANGSRPCSSHTKFDGYARLNHSADHSAAAKELSRLGYGDRPKVEYADPALRDMDPSAAPEPEKVEFRRITCAELAAGDYKVEYLIEGTLAKGQPLVIAGPQKSLKTSFIIDAGVSLATATRMLGRLEVPRPARVLVMSAESGLATIQETTRRIAKSKGWELEDIENLIFSPDVPRFGNVAHADALRDMMTSDRIEVLVVDPAYLAMPGADAGNLMVQGELLRAMGKVCESIGVTMVVAHHTRKNTTTPSAEPLELSDISWSGFAEFARQWWLVNRRERYEEGTGEHRLWLSVGGSAGHSALHAVDVNEGVWSPTEPRWWDVNVSNGAALRNQERAEQRDQKTREKDEAEQEKLDHDRTKVWGAMMSLGKPETASIIAGAAGISNGRTTASLGWLVANKMAQEAQVVRSNGQKYGGFEAVEGAKTGPDMGGDTGTEDQSDTLGLSECPTVAHTHSDRTPIGGPSPGECESESVSVPHVPGQPFPEFANAEGA